MSGLLDNKSRVLDTIVTLEGRKQVANGSFKVSYVSFSDTATYYAADIASGSADATARVYLEACNLPQDQVTFASDDSGNLLPFPNSSGIDTSGDGQILEYSFNALTASVLSGSDQGVTFVSGDKFSANAQQLLASSIDNFNKLHLIATHDSLFLEDDDFAIGKSQVEFTINNHRPIPDPTQHVTHINHIENIYSDVRFSRLQNFKFLPPVNRVDDASVDSRDSRNTSLQQLGNYKPWGRTNVFGLSPAQLEFELAHFDRIGCSRKITFDPTSRNNSLLGQFFETRFNSMKKMDVVDFGRYTWLGSTHHAFFIGKLLVDQNGVDTFVHVFTLVFGA